MKHKLIRSRFYSRGIISISISKLRNKKKKQIYQQIVAQNSNWKSQINCTHRNKVGKNYNKRKYWHLQAMKTFPFLFSLKHISFLDTNEMSSWTTVRNVNIPYPLTYKSLSSGGVIVLLSTESQREIIFHPTSTFTATK